MPLASSRLMDGAQQPRLRKTVLVTGANGFIGYAVAKAFVRAGYKTFGLVRKNEALPLLAKEEIIPVLGSPDRPTFIPDLLSYAKTFDVIVSTTEDFSNYGEHFTRVKDMIKTITTESLAAGVRPLVIFTSGCKDYGIGATSLEVAKPFTEDSPLRPPPILEARTTLSQTIFEYADLFDAVVTRPTTLFGGSSSYYGPAFELAAQAAASPERKLYITAPPNSIMHGTHVGDVAAAYVQLAESPRSKITGKVYNISSWRYETAEEVAGALVREFELDGVEFNHIPQSPDDADDAKKRGPDVVGLLFGFSQWIGSNRLREDIGWRDRQPLFTEALHVYRLAYEAAALEKHSNVERVKGLVASRNA